MDSSLVVSAETDRLERTQRCLGMWRIMGG